MSLLSIEFIYCACGCGLTTSKYMFENGKPRKDRQKKYINGHINKGKKLSEEQRMYLRNATKGRIRGETCWNWKGDNISYKTLHEFVRRHFPKPNFCQMCNKVPSYDLANITGIYNRDFKNWAYFCRKCHKTFDGMSRDPITGKFIKK